MRELLEAVLAGTPDGETQDGVARAVQLSFEKADGTERPVSGTPQGLVGRSSCEVPKEVPTYTWAADTRSATFKRIAPKTVKCEILGED